MIFGKRTGETTFMATDSNGHTLEQRTVSVTQDLSSLSRELDLAFPGSKMRAFSVPNGIVLTGEAKDPAAVTDAFKMAMRYLPPNGDIVNRVRVSGSNQIMIRVRFAEVQRTLNNSLGFDWSNLGNIGGFAFGIATGITGLAGGTGILSNRPNNTTLNTNNDVIGFSHQGQHFNVNGLIDALAQDGLITILAEPNLTAMSGETANFLAGGQFPIPIPQGNGTISIQFQSYGISLAFTPTLVGENRISLHVKPEVSELTTTGSIILNNITVPALTTRRAETTVEVASGQSFAIAGLLDNSQTQTINKYPLLGDMPIIGALFRDSQFQNGQTELVIIITPYVVKPTGEQLALPTDGFSPPSESDRLLDLRYSASDPNARPIGNEPIATKVEPTVSSAPVIPVVPAIPAMPAAPSVQTPMTKTNLEMKPITAPASIDPPPATAMVPSAPQEASMPIPPAVPAEQPAALVSVPVEDTPPLHLNPATTGTPNNLNPGGSAPAGSGGFTLE